MKKTKLASAEIPETYAELCRMLPPRKIEDKSDYANVMEVIDAMAGLTLSRDQEDYLDLLSDLAASYEDKSVDMPKVPVIEVLKELMEESGLSQTRLAEVLGIDNTLITKILKGEREISVDLARTLARQFNVDASLFLVLPNEEDEKTDLPDPKSNTLGVWGKYHVTSEDYQRYNKKKIVFAGLRSKGKTLAGAGKLMVRTYKDSGVADIFVEQWFGTYGTTLILTLPEKAFRKIVETPEGLRLDWNPGTH
jgi:HTH-type transcriptional regulator / antitoxin HigA